MSHPWRGSQMWWRHHEQSGWGKGREADRWCQVPTAGGAEWAPSDSSLAGAPDDSGGLHSSH